MLKDREHSQIKTEEIDLIDEQKEKMLPGQNIPDQRRGSGNNLLSKTLLFFFIYVCVWVHVHDYVVLLL